MFIARSTRTTRDWKFHGHIVHVGVRISHEEALAESFVWGRSRVVGSWVDGPPGHGQTSNCQRWASAILVRTSAIPQYCRQPNRLRNCGLKKLRNCDCGPSEFDFRNSATLCRLRPVSLLSCPFSSAQGGFKKQSTIFLEPFVSVETKNFP